MQNVKIKKSKNVKGTGGWAVVLVQTHMHFTHSL